MNLAGLIATYRVRADDRADPYLHDDEEVTAFANEAEKEAAERSRCFMDSTTEEICRVSLTTGVKTYLLDDRVIDVVSATVRGMHDPLHRAPDEIELACRHHNPGIPQAYAVIDAGAKLALVLDREAPDPADLTGTSYEPYLDLTVYRRPLQPMADPNNDSPEINPSRHTDLLYWMLYLGYSTRDSDAQDDQKAATNDARFTLAFGEKIDLNVRRKQLRHRPTISKPHYW